MVEIENNNDFSQDQVKIVKNPVKQL